MARGYRSKDSYIKEADNLLRNYGKTDEGTLIHPEERAAELYMKAGFSKEEAYKQVVDILQAEFSRPRSEIRRRTGVIDPDEVIRRAKQKMKGEEEGHVKIRDKKDPFAERGIPVSRRDTEGLERWIRAPAFISIIVSLFFFAPNLTGNAVLGLSNTSSNIIGVVLFVLGVLGMMFSFRSK